METFGEQLWRHRKGRGWTQAQLAARAQLSQRFVSNLEADDAINRASRSTVLRLARALALKAGPRDQLLIAAGYAPDWLQVAAADPELLYRLWSEARDGTHGWRLTEVSA